MLITLSSLRKLMLMILYLLCSVQLYAKSEKLSTLPLPTMEMVNIDPTPCDERCLNVLLEQEMFFSFLARFQQNIKNNRLLSAFSALMERHGFGLAYANRNSDAQVKIALILPKKSIGSYSLSSINTVLAYLTSQKNSFYFEVFDIADENLQAFSSTLGTIENRGFGGAILIATTKAIPFIPQLTPKIPFFVASIHKEQILTHNTLSSKIIFGGISYHEQIKALKRFSEYSAPTVLFNDESATGFRIARDIKKEGFTIALEQNFNSKNIAQFGKDIQKKSHFLRGSNIFLNTPVNNSALILSQLAYNRITPRVILTTQLGFSHALFSLTQPISRFSLYISSITGGDMKNIKEYAALLDVDLQYDWIHYATAIGTEYIYHQLFNDEKKWFKENVELNQVRYDTKIYRARENFFEVIH